MYRRLKTLRSACRRMGLANTLIYIVKTKILKSVYPIWKQYSAGYTIGTLQTHQLNSPVLFRYNSSDISVFSQIFIIDEYRPLNYLENVKFILDCGAYVGYSSAYFLSRFPEARVIAVEPDKKNFQLLKRNLEPYGNRVDVINAAIWTSEIGVKVSERAMGEEGEWVTTVRECAEGERPDVQAIDIDTLLDRHGAEMIDILKIDIEGAESVLFSGEHGWVDKVRAFAIELHNEECRQAFYGALGSQQFSYSLSGEITIAQRR